MGVASQVSGEAYASLHIDFPGGSEEILDAPVGVVPGAFAGTGLALSEYFAIELKTRYRLPGGYEIGDKTGKALAPCILRVGLRTHAELKREPCLIGKRIRGKAVNGIAKAPAS